MDPKTQARIRKIAEEVFQDMEEARLSGDDNPLSILEEALSIVYSDGHYDGAIKQLEFNFDDDLCGVDDPDAYPE